MLSPEVRQFQGEQVQLSRDITLDVLIDKLMTANVPIEMYGMGRAKTVEHLLFEILDGESHVSINEAGEIVRGVNVLALDVLYEHPNGDVYILKEEKQVFKNGRVKHRSLESSLSEKLKPHEDPEEAVSRAMREELGVQSESAMLYSLGEEGVSRATDTYPGITSAYHFYKYATVIPESSFKPEGYVERQVDKTSFFMWRKLKL